MFLFIQSEYLKNLDLKAFRSFALYNTMYSDPLLKSTMRNFQCLLILVAPFDESGPISRKAHCWCMPALRAFALEVSDRGTAGWIEIRQCIYM